MNIGFKIRAFFSLLGAGAFSLLLSSAGAGQGIFPERLDLESAVSKALDSDPQIRAARTLSKIADERTREARAFRQPTIQINQSVARSNNPVFVFGALLEQGRFTASNFSLTSLNSPEALNNLRTSISLRAPIFDQRQSRSQIDRTKIGKAQADLQIEEVSQRLRFDVIKTYFSAILADGLLKATDTAVRSAKENSRKTQDFVNVGMVAESDSLVANVELANVQQQNLEAQSAVVTTRAALNIAIGERPSTAYELVGNLQERYFPIEDESDLIRIALEKRPDYIRARLTIHDSREKTRSIRNERLPQLNTFANFGYSSSHITNGSSDYTIGLSLSYTLFDPSWKSRVEQSALSESVASSERKKLENQITLEVITAAQNYKTARSKICVSIKSVLQAEEALRILQDRYRSAISTFDAVLRAENALLRARHDLLEAKYDYYVSYASVLLATGRMTDVRPFDH